MHQIPPQPAAGQPRPPLHTEEACKRRLFGTADERGYLPRVLTILSEHRATQLQADATGYLAQALGLLKGQPTAEELDEARTLLVAACGHLKLVHDCPEMDEAVGYLNLAQAELRRWHSAVRLIGAAHQGMKPAGFLVHVSGCTGILDALMRRTANAREMRR